jgi:hypothetical protein
MDIIQIQNLFLHKMVKLGDIFLRFENKRQLIVTGEFDPIKTFYSFKKKRNGEIYLITEDPIFDNETEFHVQVFFGQRICQVLE